MSHAAYNVEYFNGARWVRVRLNFLNYRTWDSREAAEQFAEKYKSQAFGQMRAVEAKPVVSNPGALQ